MRGLALIIFAIAAVMLKTSAQTTPYPGYWYDETNEIYTEFNNNMWYIMSPEECGDGEA